MNVEVVTVATHEEGMLKKLINNSYNIKLKVLGFGEKWTGFQMKTKLIYEYIKNLPDDKIIIYLDGFDCTIQGNLNVAVNRFLKYNTKVLYANDLDSPFFGFERFIWSPCRDNIQLNCGMYMGYVKYLKILLREILKKKCKDDQIIVNKLCKKFDFIGIDVKEVIFKNIYNTRNLENEITKSNAIFFSKPGQLTYKRVARAVFEYGQFFIPFLLVIYAIIVYIWYKSKKVYHIIILTILLIIYYINMDKSCITYVYGYE